MRCEECGSEDAEETTCPYAESMQGVIIEVTLCSECYNQRVQDI